MKTRTVSFLAMACLTSILITGCSSKSKDDLTDNKLLEENAGSDNQTDSSDQSSTDTSTDTTMSNSDTSNSSTTNSVSTISYSVETNPSSTDESHPISEHLYGIFLEDINFAVDGGMYAELIKNRSFEYGTAASNTNKHGWMNTNSDVLTFEVYDGSMDESYLNENNPNYAILTNTSSNYEGIANLGYLSGLAITQGVNYEFSVYLKSTTDYVDSVHISLNSTDGEVYAEGEIQNISNQWKKYTCTLTANATISKGLRLSVLITKGSVCMDMISLMTTDTYKNSTVKRDIGEALEALNPSFLRFPGGCVIEGNSLESMYSWKDSIGNGAEFYINGERTVGDIAVRPQGKSIWNGNKTDPYYTTYGLGFYEYFILCENLNCLPVPVLNAGMTCQVQSKKYIVFDLDSEEFKQCIQDALDLVEFCLGDESTYWGKIRIAMGHETPFPLKYIGIGNEQWQTEYHEHYAAFVTAFESAAKENPALYADIQLILANGPSSGDSYGWDYLASNPDQVTGLVDEHYYESPNWFLTNTTRYDNYNRDANADVFLGEYAAKSNTLEAALAEAAFMTSLERNSDIVKLACYAPLFGNSKTNQWTPDLIWFSNQSVFGSVNYYVQQLFANNVGITTLSSSLDFGTASNQEELHGRVGLGTWKTKVAYDNLRITSNTDDSTLYECMFEDTSILKTDDWDENEGTWSIEDGRLIQSNTSDPMDTNTGDSIYVGDINWKNYTLTVDAEILGGSEGFLIPICVENTANNIFWNIGGWNNTVSCLQIVSGNSKSGQITGTVKNCTLRRNQVYQLKVVVSSSNISCYIDDELYIDYDVTSAQKLYETSSIDDNGDFILKLVNVTEDSLSVATTLNQFDASLYDQTATVLTLAGDQPNDTNSFTQPDKITPSESTLAISNEFTVELPKYSVTIIRIHKK